MKMNSYLPFIIVITMVSGFFFSCKQPARESTAVEYDSIKVQRHIPLLQENDTTLPYSNVDISFTYPVKFREAEDLARLQQIFIGTFFGDTEYDSLLPQEALDKYLVDYTAEYQELSNYFYSDKSQLEGQEMPMWYWYQLNLANSILFKNDSLLSYAVIYSDYTGGAHGSYRITYTNIDLNNLTTVSEEDIFVPGYYKPLTEKILYRLMELYEVNHPDSLMEQGFFTIEDIAPNNNFWLNDEGIHYSYNQYEIAPYAMGVIDVTIPYSDLTDILQPDGVISRFFDKEKSTK